MKILVLTIEYPPLGGGASPMIHENNKIYVRQGHEVTVVTMAFKDLPLEEKTEGVHVLRIKCRRAQKHLSYPLEHLLFIIEAKQKLKKIFKSQSFDICHTHFIMPTGILARWVKRKFHVPYIITAHGSDVPGFNPHRFIFMHRFTPPLIRSIIESGSFVVIPSLYLAGLVEKVLNEGKEKIVHIPNGIDTNWFKPGLKKPIILSSGRLLERKGFQYLIQAVANEDIGYEVHIVGDGPMSAELKNLASFSKTKIVFHGWIDNRGDLYKTLLAEASIYCLVSTNENASISLVEALSAGCAIVTSDVSGCPETVGSAGICIPPQNPGILRTALKHIIADKEYRNNLMVKARERATEHFDSSAIAMKYIALLSSTLAK